MDEYDLPVVNRLKSTIESTMLFCPPPGAKLRTLIDQGADVKKTVMPLEDKSAEAVFGGIRQRIITGKAPDSSEQL